MKLELKDEHKAQQNKIRWVKLLIACLAQGNLAAMTPLLA